jgi:hypothetical protein
MLTVLLRIATPSSTPGAGASAQLQPQGDQDPRPLSRTTSGSPVKEIFCRSGECLRLSVVDPTSLTPPASTNLLAADSSQLSIYCFDVVENFAAHASLLGELDCEVKPALRICSNEFSESDSGRSRGQDHPEEGLRCSYSYFPPMPIRRRSPSPAAKSDDQHSDESNAGADACSGKCQLARTRAAILPNKIQYVVERSTLPTLDAHQGQQQLPPSSAKGKTAIEGDENAWKTDLGPWLNSGKRQQMHVQESWRNDLWC